MQIRLGQRVVPSVKGVQTVAIAYSGLMKQHLLLMGDSSRSACPTHMAAKTAVASALASVRDLPGLPPEMLLEQAFSEAHHAIRRSFMGGPYEGKAGSSLMALYLKGQRLHAFRVGAGQIQILRAGKILELFQGKEHGELGLDLSMPEIETRQLDLASKDRILLFNPVAHYHLGHLEEALWFLPEPQLLVSRGIEAIRELGVLESLSIQVLDLPSFEKRQKVNSVLKNIEREGRDVVSWKGRRLAKIGPGRRGRGSQLMGLFLLCAMLLGLGLGVREALQGNFGESEPVESEFSRLGPAGHALPEGEFPEGESGELEALSERGDEASLAALEALEEALEGGERMSEMQESAEKEEGKEGAMGPGESQDKSRGEKEEKGEQEDGDALLELLQLSDADALLAALKAYIVKHYPERREAVFQEIEAAFLELPPSPLRVKALLDLSKDRRLRRSRAWASEFLPRLYEERGE